MRKTNSSTIKARKFLQTNPDIKGADLARKFSIAMPTAYKLKKERTVSDIVHEITLGMEKRRLTEQDKIDIDLEIHNDEEINGVSGARYTFMDTSPRIADLVNSPPHYRVGGIETIDFIEAKQLGYHLGNVVKYVSRADHKGNKKQDLEKAKWYLERAIETL
jgi:homoserine dehydrogenase